MLLKNTLLIFFIVEITEFVRGADEVYASAALNATLKLNLGAGAQFRRVVTNNNNKEIEHIYRVCNGKNKGKCGFWENTNNKKKVASGPTSFNKANKLLVIKNFRETDAGVYMNAQRTNNITVIFLRMKGKG